MITTSYSGFGSGLRHAGFQSELPDSALRSSEKTEYSAICSQSAVRRRHYRAASAIIARKAPSLFVWPTPCVRPRDLSPKRPLTIDDGQVETGPTPIAPDSPVAS